VPGVPGPPGVPDLGGGGGSSPPPSDGSSSSSSEPSGASSPDSSSSSSSSSGSPLDLPGDDPGGSDPSSPGPAAKAVLAIEAPAAAAMGEGEQTVLDVTVRNSGDAADDVSITAQGDAPVAFDTPQESLHVAPGESQVAHVRLTPTAAGSGHLTLIATGESGGTVAHDVAVSVQAKAPAAARIQASLEPSAVDAKVGQATLLTIRIVNGGATADVVEAVASGSSVMSIEPDRIQVALAPGESAVRQVRVVPLSEGHAVLSLHLTSQKGLDLTPVTSFASSGAGAGGSGGAGEDSGGDKGSGSKGSPAVAFPLLAAGLGAAAVVLLRRRRA
jgi:hypothetical protein